MRLPMMVAAVVVLGAGCGGGNAFNAGGGDGGGGGNDGSMAADSGSGGADAEGSSSGGGDAAPHDGGPGVDSGSKGDSGSGADSGTVADSGSGGDSGTVADSGRPDAGGDGGGFTVGGVPGLALWLNASVGVTTGGSASSKVSAWADQTGNHNNATQSNTNYQPTLVMQGIHSLPTVHFTVTTGSQGSFGNMMVVADNNASLDWGTGDFLIEVVGDYTNQTTGTSLDSAGTFYSKQTYGGSGGAPLGAGAALYGNFVLSGGVTLPTTGFSGWADQSDYLSSATTGYDDGTARLYAVQRSGTTLSLRLNGVQTDTKTIASVDVTSSSGARIGASQDANLFALSGDIAEIIAVQGTISSGDLAGIESYLTGKYGL